MSKHRPARLASILAAALLTLVAQAGIATFARAAAPTNGKIALTVFQDGITKIYTVNPDGSDLTKLASGRTPAVGSPVWSPDGSKIAYSWRSSGGGMDIFLMNPDGSGKTQLTDLHAYSYDPSWSPDGTRLAFVSRSQIFTVNANGSGLSQLTSDLPRYYTFGPLWSPDGTKIVFESKFQLFTMGADGSGLMKLTKGSSSWSPDWSPDGSRIAFFKTTHDGRKSIFTIAPDGTGLTHLTNAHDFDPRWSPDGSQIVFAGERGGIFTMNADGSGRVAVPGTRNDRSPDWSPDGTKFVFTHVCPGAHSHSVIGVVDIDGNNRIRLTSHANSFDAFGPSWQAI